MNAIKGKEQIVGLSMAIWDICIRRPVFTAMLLTAPLVMGLAGFSRLGVDLFPNVDVPVVVVSAVLRGASVEEMESGVTKPLEEICNTVSGIDELRSTTREGFTQIIIQFVIEKNGAQASQEVEGKVRTILGQLPEGTETPIIDRFDLESSPVLTVAVSGRRDPRETTELARKVLKEDLESLPGIGRVRLTGGRTRAIQVVVDPERLLKYENLSVEDVRRVLGRETLEQPGGRIDQGASEVVLRTMGRVDKPSDLEGLIVANRGGQPVRLADVARVEDSIEESRSLTRLWTAGKSDPDAPGDNTVNVVVQRQSGANIVKVVDMVLARLEVIKPLLPPDINLEVVRDQSRFIRNSYEELRLHVVLAAVLVSLTVLLFIRDWRTTLIATSAIPFSIIATFWFMDWMGFTLNNITMLGLILAVGIVIDDAVVVHENIFRHMEENGSNPMRASSEATREKPPKIFALGALSHSSKMFA
ncbi:MAG: efflux RND transporter permease subunit [Planctomycetota bacterium]|nr:efflux RND transporter permease subunit [Planctomycetota bacterium]